MDNTYWGWLLWLGFWCLLIASFGNWGYSYRIQRKYARPTHRSALDILNERYASGELPREEYLTMRTEIAK